MESLRWERLALVVLVALLSHAEAVAGVELIVAPTNPLEPGDPLLLSWRGVPQPSAQDWIGIYSPSTSPDIDWMGWFNLTGHPDWRTGSGTLNTTLRDLRSDYQFRLFAGPADTPPSSQPHALPAPVGPPEAVSAVVAFSARGGPQHLHLSLTSSPTEMRIMWTSAALWPGSEVQYGRDADDLSSSAPAEWATYKQEHMCEAPANTSQGWRDPGFIYDAVMTELRFGAKYFYRVGSAAGGWSAVFSFHTQPEAPSETFALVFGDMGVNAAYQTYERLQAESVTTLQLLQRDIRDLGDRPLLVSHIGDISYARGLVAACLCVFVVVFIGGLTEFLNTGACSRAWLWDEFMASIESIARHVPYHVAIGNHEYNWPAQPWNPEWASYGHDGGGECGVPYSARFHMPGDATAGTGTAAPPTRNVWYSVDVGVVHFTYISTEHNFLKGSPQYLWLEQDLKVVDRERTPFVVLSGHRPMYTSNDEERDREKRAHMVAHLEPLLVQYQVSLCLWGHVHKFERTCPLANFTCHQPQDAGVPPPVHAVIGMAGQDWQPPWAPLLGTDVYIYPIPAWSLFRQDGYGYCRLQANRDRLTLTYITNHDGQQHDYVEVLSPAAYLAGNAAPINLWAAHPRDMRSSWAGYLVVLTTVGLSAAFVILWVAHWVGATSRRQQDRVGTSKGAWSQIASRDEVVP